MDNEKIMEVYVMRMKGIINTLMRECPREIARKVVMEAVKEKFPEITMEWSE